MTFLQLSPPVSKVIDQFYSNTKKLFWRSFPKFFFISVLLVFLSSSEIAYAQTNLTVGSNTFNGQVSTPNSAVAATSVNLICPQVITQISFSIGIGSCSGCTPSGFFAVYENGTQIWSSPFQDGNGQTATYNTPLTNPGNYVLEVNTGFSFQSNWSINAVVTGQPDSIDPVITGCPISDQTATSGILDDYTSLITVSDNSGSTPSLSQNPVPGSSIISPTTVTITATDDCGNDTDCSFTVLPSIDSACVAESFEALSINANSWNNNGRPFTTGTANFNVQEYLGFGAGGSDKLLDNVSDVGINKEYSIAISDVQVMNMDAMAIYISSLPDGSSPTNDGSLTVKGILDGIEKFSVTKNSGFPTNPGSNFGFFIWDFAIEGGVDNSAIVIDEIELVLGGNFQYIAVDNFINCDAINVTPCTVSISTQPQHVEICVGLNPFEISVQATGNGTLSYIWEQSLDNGASWQVETFTGSTYQFGGATTAGTANQYRVTVYSDNGTPGDASDDCSVTSDVSTVTVNPKPAAVPTDITICSDETYTWTVNLGPESSDQSNIGPQPGNLNLTPTLTWAQTFVTASNGYLTTFRFTDLLAVNAAGDVLVEIGEGSDPNTGNIVASQLIPFSTTGSLDVSFENPAEVIAGQGYYVKFNAVSGQASVRYNNNNNYPSGSLWLKSSGPFNEYSSSPSLNDLSFTTFVSPVVDNTVNVTYDGGNGSTTVTIEGEDCEADQVLNLTVNPKPVGVSSSETPICSGEAFSYNPSTGINVLSTFAWEVTSISGGSLTGVTVGQTGTAAVAAAAGEIQNMSTNPGIIEYTVTPTSIPEGCEGDPYTITVTVNPEPTVTASASDTDVCAGESVTLTGGGADIYSWDNGVTDGVAFEPIETTTYTVTGTDANGCMNTAEVTVTVNPLPTVTFTAPADLCLDAGVQTGLGGGTPTGGVYSGTGVTDDGNGLTFTFDPAAPGVGVHTIEYEYCTDPVSNVYDNNPSTASALIGMDLTDAETRLFAVSIPTTTSGTSFELIWLGGYVGANTASAMDEFTMTIYDDASGPGTVLATINIGNGATRTPTTLTINSSTIYEYSHTVPFAYAANTTYWFELTNNTVADLDDTWAWAFHPPTNNPYYLSFDNGASWISQATGFDYTIDFGGTSGCCNTAKDLVEVIVCNQPPTVVCQPLTVDADTNCEGTAEAVDFNDGSTDPDGDLLTYTVSPEGPYPLGTTEVTLTVSDGTESVSCTTSITVVDNTPPVVTCPADITVSNYLGECSALVTLGGELISENCGLSEYTVTVDGITTTNYIFVEDEAYNQIRHVIIGPDGHLYVTGETYKGNFEYSSGFISKYNGITGELIWESFYENSVILRGLVFGPDGNLYVINQVFGEILRYDPISGDLIDVFVSNNSAQLADLVFGSNGHIYATDKTNNAIRKYDGVTGAYLGYFVPPNTAGLDFPLGLEFGPDGNLYVASYFSNSVFRFNGVTGAFIDQFIPTGSGGLSGTEDVEFGPDGNLYVTGQISNNIHKYNGTTGAFIETVVPAAFGIGQPDGLAFGLGGSLYVTDFENHRVIKVPGFQEVEFPVGTTTVTINAEDKNGNSTSCSYTVTVNDTEAPVVTCPANITVSNDPGQCDAVVTFAPTVTDNCPDDVTITSEPASGSIFPIGTTLVTVTATDGGSGGPITSAANTAVLPLGNGSDGEGIAYNPVDGLMYHASGISPGSEYFEPIDLVALTVDANLAPGNTWPAGLTQEVTGMVYYPPLNGFVVMDRSNNIALVDPVTTNFSLLSTFAGSGYIRGFAVVGTSIYGVDPFSSDLIEFDPNTGAVIATVPVVMDGSTITAGSLGLTTDPASGTVYIIYKSGGSSRSLGTIDVTTGIGTGIGVIGVNFSGISFDASGNLYAVSGDGATPPSTLFKFDESTGVGNTATCTFTVTVNDTEDPLIACPADITVSNDPGTCEAIIADLGTPIFSDNCPGVVAAFNDAFVPTGSSSLIAPYASVFGTDGNLYVTSRGTAEILRYDGTTGAFMDDFVTAGNGGLDGPIGLVFGPDGNLYVTSVETNEVLRYNGTTGDFIDAFVPAGSAGLGGPRGLVFGPNGNLYVTSVATSEILRYDGTTGAFIDAFVSAGNGGLAFPGDLVFGPDGNLYVGSFITNQVLRYDGTTGDFIDAFVSAGSSSLIAPTGLAFGPNGNLYVASAGTDEILRYDGTTGVFIDDFVSAGIGGLIAPRGLVFDLDGNLYAASLGTNEIIRYNLSYSFPVGSTTVTWTATDAAGNTATCEQTVTVNDTEAPMITCPEDITVSNDPGTCDADAVVTWTAPTGADNCTGFVVTSTHEPGDAFPLGTTEVTYTVTDAAGLTAECSFNVTVVNIIIDKIITDVSCFGGSDGSVDITATGGTPPYTYSWTGPGYFSSTSEDLSGLEAGTYEVTVTDSYGGSYDPGCSSSMTVIIGQPDAIVIDKIITDVSCFGGSDGSVDITVTGGIPPYTYSWTGPGYFGASTEDLSDLPAGTYEITVADTNGFGYGYDPGCTSSMTVIIGQPDEPLADNPDDVTECGSYELPALTNGNYFTGPDGTGDALNAGDIIDVTQTIYVYVGADTCFAENSFTVNINPLPTVAVNAINSSCFADDGSIDITVDGGTPPYTYDWSGPGYFSESTEDISDLEAGTYEVTVTDSSGDGDAYGYGGGGCTSSMTITIEQLDAIIIDADIEDVSCLGGSDGSVDITVTGGTTPYTYAWTGPGYFSANTEDLSDLGAGNYDLTVTDANGCTASYEATIYEPVYGSSTGLNIKVFLGGPYATGTGTMNYELSYNGDTPTDCPYVDEASCHTSVFNTSGYDAIVDWVWIELRDGTDGITVIESKSALIQADGDVVGTDGVSPVSFDVASANYYVMVSHRNHLGVLTANPISITACNVTNVDLTTNINMIYGGANGAQISQDGRIVLYPGDCNGDGQIQNTDKNEASPLRGLSGYINADVDMNGEVQNSDINSYLNPNIGKGVQTGGSRSANLSLHAKRK